MTSNTFNSINKHLANYDSRFYVGCCSGLQYKDTFEHNNVIALCMTYRVNHPNDLYTYYNSSIWWPHWEFNIEDIKLMAHRLDKKSIRDILTAIVSDRERNVDLCQLCPEDKIWVMSRILGNNNE